MTTWVLLITLFYDRSMSYSTIQNLKSYDECKRVQEVVKGLASYGRKEFNCIEVINK